MRAAARTSTGKVRERNEDAVVFVEETGVFIVCDGMGGHHGGDVASQLVACTLLEALGAHSSSDDDPEAATARILAAMALANQRVFEAGRASGATPPMGTTAVVLWQPGPRAFVAHVGDSRCYRLRRHDLERLTVDHTFVEDARASAQASALDPSLLRHYAHVLTRSLGHGAECSPDARLIAIDDGDRFLLCSDGLSGVVDDDVIAEILGSASSPDGAASALVDAANAKGGPDNVTALVVWASRSET